MYKNPISDDANKLILILYNAYLKRCNYGLAKFDAEYFGDDTNIISNYAPSWDNYILDKTLKELLLYNFIYASELDEHICHVRLNYFKTAEYFYTRFKKTLFDAACNF